MPDRLERLPPSRGLDALDLPVGRRGRLRALGRDGRRPLRAVFTGPSGTGKTTAARAVAADLKAPVYRIDLSQVVSKYIGETEKNLSVLLDRAAAEGAVVLLDEADDLLTGRTETAEAVLGLVEAHAGPVIVELRTTTAPTAGLAARFADVVEFVAPGVYVEEIPSGVRSISAVETSVAAFVGGAASGPVDTPTTLTSFSDYEAHFGARDSAFPMSTAVFHFFDNGGTRAIVVRVAASGGSPVVADADIAGSRSAGSGMWALRGSGFAILVLPPPGPGADISATTRREALRLCAEERAFHIVDPPESWGSVAEVDPVELGLVDHQENAAVYWPRLLAPDATGATVASAPGGAVAGVYARTDIQRGVWKAPAGVEAALAATGTAVAVTDATQDLLNPIGVNALREFPGRGLLVWGSRTLDTGSEWRYVPVRRTMLMIEESLYRGLQWVVFEPNDEPVWAQIRASVETFFNGLFRQGAFAGTTPDEAFFVRCDTSTTTPSDRQAGITNVVIGFAPLKPAEFVVVTLALRRAP